MVKRVYVHVGPHKTGTTFVQQVMQANRALFAEDGVLFPGRPYAQQRTAVLELLRRAGRPDSNTPGWDRLVSEVCDWSGDAAVISVENLDSAEASVIRRIVDSFADAEVHVIYTARDLARVIPARWHTHMRNRDHRSWQQYLAEVRRDAGTRTGLWAGQDPRSVLPRWEQSVPREHIHVVTVPPSGAPPVVLWQRFCSVIGVRHERYSLDIERRNESLGTAETEALRLINERVGRRISRPAYIRWVQSFVAREVLERREGQTRFALPPSEYEWIEAITKQIAEYLRDGGYEVTGDLDDLVPMAQPRGTTSPDDTDAESVLDVTVDVIAALLTRIEQGEHANAVHEDEDDSWSRDAWNRRAIRRLRFPAVVAGVKRLLRRRHRLPWSS